MQTMRYRIPELLKGRGWPDVKKKGHPSAYRLHVESVKAGHPIALSVCHRLVTKRGMVKQFDGDVVEALCDTLGVSIGELLERDQKQKRGKR